MDLHGEVFTVKVLAVVCEGRRRPMRPMTWWEIEGFYLTIGDGCRKLGGHGREMILRRSGDSRLVDVEFVDELQECKKPMPRDLTGLMTNENSGVAGYSAAAVVEARRVASSTIELPRCEAVESQKSAQVPDAPLYCAFVVGKCREAPKPFHLGGDEAVTVTMPVVSLDDFSQSLSDSTTGEGNTSTIVPSDSNTTYDTGFMAPSLTERVRAHGARCEFFNKFPDHKNATFEETDAAQDEDP